MKWKAAGLILAALLAGVLAMRHVRSERARTAATAKDEIFARRILMDAIGGNMDEIETMTSTNKIDLADAREHAGAISAMLLSFPHLFPPSTNQWKPGAERDPGTDTYAGPEIWAEYADFYKRGKSASETAFKASRAKNVVQFKTTADNLRQSCNACHALYQKTDAPPP